MKKIYILSTVLLTSLPLLTSCNTPTSSQKESISRGDKNGEWLVSAPQSNLKLNIFLEEGNIYYQVKQGENVVVNKSSLTLDVDIANFTSDLKFYDLEETKIITSYENKTGKKSQVEVEANETKITFYDYDFALQMTFRVYDTGYAFRYYVYALDNSTGNMIIHEENTSFALPEDTRVYYMEYVENPSDDRFSYEENYKSKKIDRLKGINLSMPLLYKTNDNIYSLIAESELIGSNYIGSFLTSDENGVLKTIPAHHAHNNVEVTYPFYTPWRTAAVGDLNDIVNSTIVEDVYDEIEYYKPDNYNELSQEEKNIYNYDWVKPGKCAWTWLKEYHGINPNTGIHTQKNYEISKKYIDYASQNGWNWFLFDAGWEPDNTSQIEEFKSIVEYANSKNVHIMVWAHSLNELSTPAKIDACLRRWKLWGIEGLKIDFFDGMYVDPLPDARGEHQDVINIYDQIYQISAKYQMVLNIHGANKPTGERRKYPHVINREAIRGNEWRESVSMSDVVTIPYIRSVVGPSDYTPTLVPCGKNTTMGSQLAMHVLYETGMITMADTPANYASNQDVVTNFLNPLPITWDEIKYLNGDPLYSCVIARRKGDTWWIGGVSTLSKNFELDLSFLEKNKTYNADIYSDGSNGYSLNHQTKEVNSTSLINVSTLDVGGFGIKITIK